MFVVVKNVVRKKAAGCKFALFNFIDLSVLFL